ncbi:hypothetical protein, partial [Paramuribaculum intestinale]|uniref:hypothetical protein n=1 Tax=Paramuribaculum intestinale TaxID=2094151 RepID=UPI0025B54349
YINLTFNYFGNFYRIIVLVSEMDSYAGTTVWVSHYKFMQHFSRHQIFATIFPLLSCRAQNMFFNTMRVVEGWFGVELKKRLCKFAKNRPEPGLVRYKYLNYPTELFNINFRQNDPIRNDPIQNYS